jgi:hypothetical protein
MNMCGTQDEREMNLRRSIEEDDPENSPKLKAGFAGKPA